MDTEFARSSRAGPPRPEQASPPAGWSAPWMPGPVVTAADAVARSNWPERLVPEDEARRVAYEERLRVAREIHDVVGHGLAVINLQAGIALHVMDRRPDQAAVALEAVKTASKAALEELRGVLAVVRRQDLSSRTRPAGGLDRMDALVGELNEWGLPVRLEVRGERAAVPGAVDLAAYRIVQESLTNVLRHARPAAATVRIGFERGAVSLEIVNDTGADADGSINGHGTNDQVRSSPISNGHGGGQGINGMRERAAALGGTFEAGPRPGGGFRVRARLPACPHPTGPDQATDPSDESRESPCG